MKLFYFPPAPNPARVLFYVKEKGIELELVLVDFTRGEHKSPEIVARNPASTLPILELDDGTCLLESVAIIEYLEECFPEPAMIGTDAVSRAQTRAVERYIEMNFFLRVIRIVHATNSPLGLPQNPSLAESEQARLPAAISRIDQQIGDSEFVMGAAPSIADCTLLAAVNFARFGALDVIADAPNLERWFEHFALRHL